MRTGFHNHGLPRYISERFFSLWSYVPELREAGAIWVPELPTLVYTAPKNAARRRRVQQVLGKFGFTRWEFVTGRDGGPYWVAVAKDHAEILRRCQPPLLVLEDDIEPREFRPNVFPPGGSQVVYLGGGRGGIEHGRSCKHDGGQGFVRSHNYGYQPIDEEWFRVCGMWFSHAILWLEKGVMLEAAAALDATAKAVDTVYAENQHRWRVVCRRVPMFWQNDGHHHYDTYEYRPEYPACKKRRR